MVQAFLRYWWRAGTLHGLHSPFVYALYRDVIRDRHAAPAIASAVESLRQVLLQLKQTIEVTDLGAGSRGANQPRRAVAQITRYAQKPRRYAWLLHRLVRLCPAAHVLELGTSLGLTTAYLADAVRADDSGKSSRDVTTGHVQTFEGCPNTAALARAHLERLGLSAQVQITVGNLDDTLPTYVTDCPPVDVVFFDANHRYAPTVQYFTVCLPKIHNNSLFIFDDIHWSAEMEQAWATIQAHPLVTLTIDLFGVGLVFFRKEQPKQHFTLRF